MKSSRLISFLLIIIGGTVALYAQAGTKQNVYLLIGGVFILMMGVYRVSRNIPSKYDTTSTTDDKEN